MYPHDLQNPTTIAFVARCLQLGALDAAELRAWAEELLITVPDCPIYLEGLAEFDGPPEAVFRFIGFVPEREFSSAEDAAIRAIATLRRAASASPEPAAAAARSVLETAAAIAAEFRRTFPQLEWEGG